MVSWAGVFFCAEHHVATIKVVSGRSMYPTFNERGPGHCDVVVLDRWSAKQLQYKRGDVVVLRSPHDPDEMLTKRIVALPGDSVRPRADPHARRPTHVPRGQLWVEGDNESSSNDSNSFGCVPSALIEARVCLKLWPLNEAGRVRHRELARERLAYRGPLDTVGGGK